MNVFTTWAFRNKAAVLLMVLLMLAVGTVSYFKLPLEYFPEASMKQVSVTTLGQGYDSKSMADDVTSPVEKAVSNVKGKTDVFSVSGDGFSKVDIKFEADTDMKQAEAEVQKALERVSLPANVMKPMVTQLDTSMIPISNISIAFKDGLKQPKNMELVEKTIVPKLEAVEGAANVSLYGKTNTQVSLKLDKAKMEKEQVPLQTVMGILEGQHLAAGVGAGTIDGEAATIKVVGRINDLEALKNLQVAPNVKLKQIAAVEMKVDAESVTRINGKDAMLAMVQKEAGYNAVTIGKDLSAAVDQLNKEVPNLEMEVIWANSDLVVNSVNSMLKEVGMGALFATIVILLFLRNLRTTFITIISIPLSLALTLFLLHQTGITLNILTLGGVAVAVGRLVDDSIVVIENIFRKAQRGEAFNRDMIVSAVKEVGGAITSSTLTTVAVFLPMGLVQGSLHDFLLPFALTVTYSLLSSLLVALTVVPLLSLGLLKNAKLPQHREPKRYVGLLRWSLNHKWVTVLIAVVLFGGTIGLYVSLPKAALDTSDSSLVTVSLKYPSAMPTEQVVQKGIELETFLLEQQQTKSVMMFTGSSAEGAKFGDVGSASKIDYNVTMNKGADADKFIEAVKAKHASQFKDAEFTIEAASMTGGSGGSSITWDIVGQDEEALKTVSGEVTTALKNIDGIDKVTSNQEETKPVYTIRVDPSAANAQQIAGQLHMLLNDMPIGMIKLDNQDTAVVLDASTVLKTKGELNDLMVATAAGVQPLSKVASITKTNEASTVLHKGGKPYIRIEVVADGKKLSEVTKAMQQKRDALKLPAGVTIEEGGASKTQQKEMSDMAMTILVSIGLVYLIMVLTFKTLRAPLAILFSLPLAAVGAVLGLLVTNTPVDTTSMIGALMLIGIVVTNAIVLIERVKQNEETMTIREALLEAGAARLRPIMMTAIATVCAMLPLMFQPSELGSIVSKGLAVVVIGGLIVSTLLTLVAVPVVYEILHFRKAKKQRVAQASQNDAQELVA